MEMSLTAGSINLFWFHIYVHYHNKTKWPACMFGHMFRCVFSISGRCCSVSESPPLPNSLKLLWNVTWLNIAVCHFTFGSQTREPVNTCFPLAASWAVRIQVLGGTRIQLVKRISRLGSSIQSSASGWFLQACGNGLCFSIHFSPVRKIHLFICLEMGVGRCPWSCGCVLNTVTAAFWVHLETGEGSTLFVAFK